MALDVAQEKLGGGEVHEIKRKIVEYIYIWINSNYDNQIAIYFGSFLGRHICQYCHHTSKLWLEWWQYWQILHAQELINLFSQFLIHKIFKSKKEIEIFSKYPDQDAENPTQTLRVGFPMKSAKKLEIQSKDLAHFTENLPCGVNIPRRIFPKWHHFSNFDLRSGNCRIAPAGNLQ